MRNGLRRIRRVDAIEQCCPDVTGRLAHRSESQPRAIGSAIEVPGIHTERNPDVLEIGSGRLGAELRDIGVSARQLSSAGLEHREIAPSFLLEAKPELGVTEPLYIEGPAQMRF